MIVELHPEELLDREAAGALTPAERSALEAHSARCAACECERRLRVAFADVLREPARSPPRAAALVPMSRAESPAPAVRLRARPLRAGRAWLAALAVFVASAAAAQEMDAPALTVHTEREVAAHTVERIRVAAASAGARRGARAHVTPIAPVAAVAALTPFAPGTAESLFDDANRARVRRDYEAAVVAYRRLQDRYPASREARISYVTMGRMQLDRADAAGALVSFERYAQSGDVELDDVAMAGRALALDDVGSAGAPRAWLSLLRVHPESPYANHARLRALAGGSAL